MPASVLKAASCAATTASAGGSDVTNAGRRRRRSGDADLLTTSIRFSRSAFDPACAAPITPITARIISRTTMPDIDLPFIRSTHDVAARIERPQLAFERVQELEVPFATPQPLRSSGYEAEHGRLHRGVLLHRRVEVDPALIVVGEGYADDRGTPLLRPNEPSAQCPDEKCDGELASGIAKAGPLAERLAGTATRRRDVIARCRQISRECRAAGRALLPSRSPPSVVAGWRFRF